MDRFTTFYGRSLRSKSELVLYEAVVENHDLMEKLSNDDNLLISQKYEYLKKLQIPFAVIFCGIFFFAWASQKAKRSGEGAETQRMVRGGREEWIKFRDTALFFQHRDTETQRHKDTKTQRHKDTKTQSQNLNNFFKERLG